MSDDWNNATPATLGGPEKNSRRAKAKPMDDPDRLPPHSPEAEAGVLGCILLSPVECMDDCMELGVADDWFYDSRHKLIWHGITRLHATGTAIDTITLRQWLADSGHLADAGGPAYFAGLPDAVPSAANLLYYVDIAREKAHARLAIAAFTEGVSALHEGRNPAAAELAKAQKSLESLAEIATEKRDTQLKSLLLPVIDKIEDGYHRGSAQIHGLTTGLEYLDKILCGIGGENGNMVVLSARPGIGKTSLALQIAEHVALDHRHFTPKLGADGLPVINPETNKPAEWVEHKGQPVGIFSLEMSAEALTKRLLFQRARADMQRFRNGFALKEDFEKLAKAAAELNTARIWVDDTGRCTIDELKARARKMHRAHGIKLFVVDYIQLLRVSRRDRRNERREELEEISGELFKLGKELNVPFLILAQMNRDFEKDPNRIPRLSDLKDCGAIEQDADLILFLYNNRPKGDEEDEFDTMMDRVYGKDWSSKPTRVDCLVAKNRFGMSDAKSELLFQKSSTLFLDFVRFKKERGFKDTAKGERKTDRDEML